MEKYLRQVEVREILDQHSKGDISYSKMVELLNKKVGQKINASPKTITLTYNLDDPDSKRHFDMIMNADKYNIALFEIMFNLRRRIKSLEDERYDDLTIFYEVTEVIVNIIEESGLTEEKIEYHANG